MHHHPAAAATLVLLGLLALAACQAGPVPASSETQFPSTPCDPCAQATQLAALTQASINASALQAQGMATDEIQRAQALATAQAGTATQSAALAEAEIEAIALQAQAAATADILRAHALATFNAASSTQGAALTQDRINASALQAQAAATADVLRANALATFNAASSTQSSALTQAAHQQAQMQLRLRLTAEAATQSAAATGTQQWMGAMVAGTATTLARAAIQQTESAAAQEQQAADQRQTQQQGPIVFLWKWGLPLFILAGAGLCLWGLWRWLMLRTTRQGTGGPVILWERRRGLGEDLPSVLRWLASFIETKSFLAASTRPVDPVSEIDSDLAHTPPATDLMPQRDQELEGVTATVPGVSPIETDAPPNKVRQHFPS